MRRSTQIQKGQDESLYKAIEYFRALDQRYTLTPLMTSRPEDLLGLLDLFWKAMTVNDLEEFDVFDPGGKLV